MAAMPVLREESVVRTSPEKVDVIVLAPLLSPVPTDTVEGDALRLEATELSADVPVDGENIPWSEVTSGEAIPGVRLSLAPPPAHQDPLVVGIAFGLKLVDSHGRVKLADLCTLILLSASSHTYCTGDCNFSLLNFFIKLFISATLHNIQMMGNYYYF